MYFPKILILSSVSFIAGIFLSSFYEDIAKYLPILFILGFCLAVSFSWTKNTLPIALIFIFIGFGSFWFNISDVRESTELSSFRGTVIKQPELREKSAHFVLSGGVLLITERHAEYQYGDILEIMGKITPPEPFGKFDYPGYLAKEGIYWVAYRPKVEVVGHEKMYKEIIVTFRERASEYLSQSLPQPHSSIAAAMLLGEKREIPPEWQDKLSAAGVRHITAVSGLHVTVVTAIVTVLFAGLGRRRSLPFVAGAISFFVLMTGLQASAIRAGIMGGCLIFAKIFGRMSSSARSVIIAASLMLLLNPLLLRYDIGFQLSFLAVIGIIQLSPLIEKKLSFLPSLVREITAMSFAAYIFTLPVIIYHFGKVSLVFLATNLLIIPVLYIIMLLGFAFIILSFVSGAIASIILLPFWFFTAYLVRVVDFFAGLPWSSTILTIEPVTIIIFYLLLALAWKKNSDDVRLVLNKNSGRSADYVDKI